MHSELSSASILMPIRAIALAIIFLLSAAITAAPGFPAELPLSAPVLAVETAAGDALLLLDVTTGAQRELRLGTGFHRLWGFSPDGCRLLYTLNSAGSAGQLYSARLDGSDARTLVSMPDRPPGEWGVWDAQWSPRGDRIAFVMRQRDPARTLTGGWEHRIGWIPADGGVPAFYSVSGDEHTPRWSPDGVWLAYVSYETGGTGSAQVREAEMWVVSADGITKYRLTNFPSGNVSMPRWSPDGELIGFVYSPSANNDTLWMIGNAPDAQPTQLSYATSLALDLTWLPDSTAMVAALRDFRDVAENRLWQIPLVGIADQTAFLLADDPLARYADYPRFSADGRYLAIRSEYALSLLDRSTGVWSALDVPIANTPPHWTPAAFTGEAACA